MTEGVRIVAAREDGELLEDVSPKVLPGLLADETVHVWVDTWGAVNEEALRLARDVFRFHSMALVDCFETREHPKVEGFDQSVFLITHGLSPGSSAEETEIVELDVFLGKRFLFTYHEKPSRSVEAARTAVMQARGGPLRRGPAALLHVMLDRQVDGLQPVVDSLETRIEQLEEGIVVRPLDEDLVTLLNLKRTTLHLRRWMSKQREVVLRVARNEFALVPPQDAILFRDVYDHLQRLTDLVENHREMITSLQETYLSMTNLRLGEIMKFLTLFTAVLMPLTVITGIYGMNFEHMPELRRWWAYPVVLGVMSATVVSVLWFFRRKGWLGRLEPGERS